MSPSLFMGYLNSLSLDRQFSQYIYKVFLDGFVILDGLREGNVYHFIVVNAYHDIALSFHDGVDGGCAQTAGKDTVVCRRATTALQVTEDGYAYVILGVFVLYTLCIVHCTAGQFTLGYQYDTAVLGFPETVLDEFFQLVHFRTEFRDNGCFCSGGDGGGQRGRKPASRPMTSTKNKRSWEVAVSRILSTASRIVFSAVS